MTRPLLLRRCSMSSIEEEDESIVSDEQSQPFPRLPDWDSEFSESEQEFEENNEHDEERAANRALQHFIQSSLRTHPVPNDGSSFADDSAALNILMSDSFSRHGCTRDLRTLEDQLEAALASLTFTINETTATLMHSEQRSSDFSASSSGVGEEMPSEAKTVPLTISVGDDADSAFSDSGSLVPSSGPDESLVSPAQHPSKILVRTYNDDGSTKSIFIDDSLNIRDVLFLLIHKNHREAHIDYVLVEILPDLHMERIFEDHQKLSEAILMWPTVSSNRLNFTQRSEKYSLFRTLSPENGFLPAPDTEGIIYLKEKARKSWKKHFCVLRSSGLYFIPKGKSKKDLICLAKFENVELFFGLDWKKKFKSPSDFCFALKHPLIQKKSSKYIKYMCVENKTDFERWIVNIRIAKFGQQLKMNYLFMEKAMNLYRSSGRFIAPPVQRVAKDPPMYHPLHLRGSIDEHEDRSPIKSASYMDELRQRLERVVNDPPPSSTLGSTPLPRKHFAPIGSLSYRTTNFAPPSSAAMSQSFIIPSKREIDPVHSPKALPLVPPRKSSHLSVRRPHVSHL